MPPLTASTKVSKTARAAGGLKQRQRVPQDAEGRELERVLVVPVKGRKRLEWRVKV